MTNLEKWFEYNKQVVSPSNYIEFSWYYLISSALQRRCWVGPSHQKLYPSQYIILVGEPGVGKGVIIKRVLEILRHHKLKNKNLEPSSNFTDAEKMAAEALKDQDLKVAQEQEDEINKGKKAKSVDEPLLFSVAPEATTYEALVHFMAESIRKISYKVYDEELGKDTFKIYTHSSSSFCLEELSSLFKKKTEDVVNFLIVAFDCGTYTKITKTQGNSRVRDCCLNLLAGTTPDYMQNTFDEQIIGQGFSSRTHFIFAEKNRFNLVFADELTEHQKQCKQDILDHIKKLSTIYGNLQMEEGLIEYINNWWDKEASKPKGLGYEKLKSWESRLQVHVLKLATAIHFGETTEMILRKDSVIKAIAIFERERVNMLKALQLDNKNPLSKTTKDILAYIAKAELATYKELQVEFWGKVRDMELTEIMTFLQNTEQVSMKSIVHPITHQVEMKYYIKSKEQVNP